MIGKAGPAARVWDSAASSAEDFGLVHVSIHNETAASLTKPQVCFKSNQKVKWEGLKTF